MMRSCGFWFASGNYAEERRLVAIYSGRSVKAVLAVFRFKKCRPRRFLGKGDVAHSQSVWLGYGQRVARVCGPSALLIANVLAT